MKTQEAFEFNKVSQAEVEVALKRAHQMRSDFAADSFKSVVNLIKSALQSKPHVHGGSNLAHSA